MKKAYYLALLALLAFELTSVWLIMPFPGSQRLDSLELAYTLHAYRWFFRVGIALAMLAAARETYSIRHKWAPALATLVVLAVAWFLNYRMSAEAIFRKPEHLAFAGRAESSVGEDSLVLGIERNGEAKAYPIRFLVYHHQVPDTVGGEPVLVTYCSVCRTGRVFSPVVDGTVETFRLVGMDHFNAMLEDVSSRSWWRQATGEAVAGPRKGARLAETDALQVRLATWLELHPDSLVMQPDPAFLASYDTQGRFERGESTGPLTRTDPGAWQDKSWVVGIEIDGASKAYDWNALKERGSIEDTVGGARIVLVLASDGQSFAAFRRTGGPDAERSAPTLEGGSGLVPLVAHQEFWHSWRTFHPATLRYP